MAIVNPADRPKSVRNRVIEVFGGVFVLSQSHCFLDFSVGVGAFVVRLSQISSFFSLNHSLTVHHPSSSVCFRRLLQNHSMGFDETWY